MRGKKSHKGRNRRFTSPEGIDRQLGLKDADETEEAKPSTSSSQPHKPIGDQGSTESDSSDDETQNADGSTRAKGVSHLIEVHNPNLNGPRDVPSRKEAEAAARAVMNPLKLKSEAELASDLARLALVRKEREQAALKREQEKAAREAAREAAAQRAQTMLEAVRQKKSGKPGAKKGGSKQAKSEATPKPNTTTPSGSTRNVNQTPASEA